MKRSLIATMAFGVLATAPAIPSRAASNASDNASTYTAGNSYIGGNNGTGFLAFTATNGANAGFFAGASTGNGSTGASGGIDTTGKSFGMFANSGDIAAATRAFTSGGPNSSNILAPTQTFSLSLDTGVVNTGGNVGFNLFNAASVSRLTLKYVAGATDYVYNIGGADLDTGVAFTSNGLSISFTQNAANGFSLKLTPSGGATTTLSGVVTAADINQVQVFNSNAGAGGNSDLFFNNLAIVPEPGTIAALSLGAFGFIGILRRRQRE